MIYKLYCKSKQDQLFRRFEFLSMYCNICMIDYELEITGCQTTEISKKMEHVCFS